jgi:tRNA(His) 5'-end guanylyltransferase
MKTLKDRIEQYEKIGIQTFLPKIPLIIKVNGRSFGKVTRLLNKPFDQKLAECFYASLLALVQGIDGAFFGFHFNDYLIIALRNDQSLETEPFANNDGQKISSIASSIVTSTFLNLVNSHDLTLMGETIFSALSFTVPTLTEASNSIIFYQQKAFQTAINSACFYELMNKFNKEEIKEMLTGLTSDEKIDLLRQEMGIDFADYPLALTRGVAAYKAPKIGYYEGKETIKNSWTLNTELPIFTRDQSFLSGIFKNGSDILR